MFEVEGKFSLRQLINALRSVFLIAVVTMSAVPALAGNDLLLLPASESPRASGAMLLDVARAGQNLVAVGDRGHVLISENNGLSWQQSKVPVSVTLTAVHFPSATQGWVVGHDGVVLHSSDGGERWTLQFDGVKASQLLLEHYEKLVAAKEKELELATEDTREALTYELEDLGFFLSDAQYGVEEGPWKPFLDVWFADEKTGYIVGAYGMMFRTTDGGASWQPWGDRLDNPQGLHLNAITSSAAGLFIAGEMGTLYKSTDGGDHWETLESPYEGSFFGAVADELGQMIVAMGLRGNAIRSVDGGATWQHIKSPNQAPLLGGTILPDGRVAIASASLLFADNKADMLSASKVKPSVYSAVAVTADDQLVLVGLHGAKRIEWNMLEGEDK